MMRLVKAGLMFGNLIEVRSPALVARYNRALKHLIGKETALTDFHVDISGYSPEIGDEFGDTLYLNPNGCNRQFILLTTDQKKAPLLNAQFSTSRSILRNFITANEDQLFALTAREAVAGELMNSVYSVSHPRDLLNIRKIEIEADTVHSHISEGQKLQKMIDRFTGENDAWWDDVLIAEMIETAKGTGNILRNPVSLSEMEYEQGNYYTRHFGGAYVFRDMEHPALIGSNTTAEFDDVSMGKIIDIRDRNMVAKFLELNELTEPVVYSKSTDVTALLQQKMDFIVIDAVAAKVDDLTKVTRQDIRRLVRQHLTHLPPEFQGLMELYRWTTTGGKWPRITSDHPSYFYTLRASDHKDKDLVNALLAELCPLDFRKLFIFNKEMFYEAYRGWPEAKKDYVVKFLKDEYMLDKAGAREALYGNEPTMEPEEKDSPDLVTRVGPWGAVGGKS